MTISRIITISLIILLLTTLSFAVIYYYMAVSQTNQVEQGYQEIILSQVDYSYRNLRHYIDQHLDQSIYPDTLQASQVIASYTRNMALADVPLSTVRNELGLEDHHFFLIDQTGLVVNTTYESDLGLNLLNLDSSFSAHLLNLLTSSEDQFWSPGIDLKSDTKEAWLFTYYSPANQPYIIQIGLPAPAVSRILADFTEMIAQFQELPGISALSIVNADGDRLLGEPISNRESLASAVNQAIIDNQVIIDQVHQENAEYLRYIMPITLRDGYRGQEVIVLTLPQDLLTLPNYLPYFIGALLAFVITLWGISRYLKIKLVAPLQALTDYTKEISASNLLDENHELNAELEKNQVAEIARFYQTYTQLLQDIRSHEAENYAQHQEIQHSSQQISTLNQRLEAVLKSFENIHSLNKREFFQRIFADIFLLIPEAQKGSCFELRDNTYRPVAYHGFDAQLMKELAFSKGESFFDADYVKTDAVDAYQITLDQTELDCSEETKQTLKKLDTYRQFTVLHAPILVNSQVVGSICLDNFDNHSFSVESRGILKYYAQLTTEFYNHRYAQETLNETYMDMVTALVHAIELKDSYTMGHGKRVSQYSKAISQAIGLSEKETEQIELAALLHDIGKIGVPEQILQKTGKLTAEEYTVIKQHPVFSKQILEKLRGFTDISQLVYYHHENHRGGGYPEGIPHSQVPLGAQIIQVADAYDAMTSNRSYRPPLSPDVAMKNLELGMGTQFNPAIVEVAIEKVFKQETEAEVTMPMSSA